MTGKRASVFEAESGTRCRRLRPKGSRNAHRATRTSEGSLRSREFSELRANAGDPGGGA